MRIRFLAGAVLLLPFFASAQQKPVIPNIGESIEVSIVNLDVIVTNKAGERVHGLTKDDFEILENGKVQPISNFAEYTATAPLAQAQAEATTVAPPQAPPQKRTIIVFIERFYLPDFRTQPFFASLKKLLHDAVRPGDRALIVTWNRGVLLTPQDFTDSLPLLDHALDGVAKLSSKPVADVRADVRFMVNFARQFDADSVSSGGSAAGSGLADMQMDYFAQVEKAAQERKVQTINALMRTIAADEGKKIMILVTHRLSRYAGLDTYLGNATSGATETKANNLERLSATDMRNALKAIDDTANANGVTIYPLFPEGLDTTMTDASETASVPVVDYHTLANETSALNEIAEETGGLTAWGGDAAKLLPQVAEDLDSYYSLAYRVRSSGADKGKKVVVRAKNPALTVRSRREFMDKSDVTRMEDRVIAALFGNPPSPGFPLKVGMGKRETRGRKTTIPLKIYVPISALTQLQDRGSYAGAFSVYFAWGGTLGGISDTSHATKTYAIPAQQIAAARTSGHLTYEIELSVDDRTERLAFGVLDEVSKEYALRLIQLR